MHKRSLSCLSSEFVSPNTPKSQAFCIGLSDELSDI